MWLCRRGWTPDHGMHRHDEFGDLERLLAANRQLRTHMPERVERRDVGVDAATSPRTPETSPAMCSVHLGTVLLDLTTAAH